MANRDDRAAQPRAAAAVWLRSPRLWRGLLVAGLVVGAFGWAATVLGIALATAQEGAEQWWLAPARTRPGQGIALDSLFRP